MPPRVAVPLAAIALPGLLLGEPGRAWGAYLLNLMFWTTLASGALALSAAIRVSDGRWAGDVQPLLRRWLPVLWLTALLFPALVLGAGALYPWATAPVEGLEGWLAPLPLFLRDGVALVILAAVAHGYVRAARREDTADAARRSGDDDGPDAARWGVAVLLLYPLVVTLLAVDLVMSLEPPWISTLLGAHVFVGGAYTALAAIPLLDARRLLGAAGAPEIGVEARHDVGKLLFAFCLLWTYMFWSQYLVIWYGNLPRESVFWIQRTAPPGWRAVAWVVLAACFALPFVALLSRRNRRDPRRLAVVAGVALLGMWLERLLLVMPSIVPADRWPVGWPELLVSVGFLGLVGWSVRLPATVSER